MEQLKNDLALDVREIPHARRHATIFAVIGELDAGQALVITNDHDPAPLRYQLRALHGETFGWEYLESGPEVWRVAIRKEAGSADDFDLEVRHLAPAKRHELILETYQGLEAGQGFILINDHDPKPLYYQFMYEYPDAFTWDSLEAGPEVWRVRIGKPIG